MQVLLLKNWPPLGKSGELKEVSEGFARNFLLPKKIAEGVTVESKQRAQAAAAAHKLKLVKEADEISGLKKDLEKRTFSIKIKVGESGQIFGGVREKAIIQRINSEMNLNLDKNQLKLAAPLKQLGEHKAVLNLKQGITANLNLKLEPFQ